MRSPPPTRSRSNFPDGEEVLDPVENIQMRISTFQKVTEIVGEDDPDDDEPHNSADEDALE